VTPPGAPPPALFDTHAHLHFPEFAEDRDEALTRARAAGVSRLLVVGADLASSRAAVAFAAAHPGVYAAVGIHPHDAETADPASLSALATLAREAPVVAIGEIGLDYYRDLAPRPAQDRALRAQLDLARALGRPVVLHCREAHAALLEILEGGGLGPAGGILHCFSGDRAAADRGLALGLAISIAGPVTYPGARRLADVVRAVPLEALVLETDCPYLPPQPWRGRRNEPAYLPVTATRVAELRGLDLAAVATATKATACRVRRVPPPGVAAP
jgi:TatD DNase family protein